MKIPVLYVHEVLTEWLYALFFQGECLHYQDFIVTADNNISLNIPYGARYALIVIEADPNLEDRYKSRVIRFLETEEQAEADKGMPLGEMGVYEVKGMENMTHFNMIGIYPGFQHRARVQYFG